MPDLFSPIQLGATHCANRIFMAPMTRSRAGANDEPTELSVEYYAQRASAGLIITEGVYPSIDGKGYVRTPGIVTREHIKAWAKVSKAVHDRNGKIFMQLMHCGRVGSHYNKHANARTLAPSPIQAKGEIYTDAAGMQPNDAPEEMSIADITQTVLDFKQAALNAVEAGFDGVELHCTSGYLPAQFLSTGSNQRTDQYGGSLQNRLRFVLETLEAISGAVGSDRLGIRICPGNPFNDLSDDDPEATFGALLQEIDPMSLAYLHVIRMNAGVDNIALAKRFYTGNIILNDSYDLESGNAALKNGDADAISFGRKYIANPRLVEALKTGDELRNPDFKLLYTPGAEGYTTYS